MLTILACLLAISCDSDVDFVESNQPSIANSSNTASANGGINTGSSSQSEDASKGYDGDSMAGKNPEGEGEGESGYDGDSNEQSDGEYDGDSSTEREGSDGEYDGDSASPLEGNSECMPNELEVAFPEEIQSCFDGNRIWDFNRNLCTEISGSCLDDCKYDNLILAINDAGMGTPRKIEEAIGKAKLITWGTKNDGKTIVAQWVYPPSGSSCTYDLQKGLPVTGCYRILPPGSPTLDKSNPDAVEAFVNACIDD